jgi:hypothetical protein
MLKKRLRLFVTKTCQSRKGQEREAKCTFWEETKNSTRVSTKKENPKATSKNSNIA